MWHFALESIKNNNKLFFGPKSFLEYCSENNLANSGTANHISIDYFEKLSKELRAEDFMVLRLGSTEKKMGTKFILVKYDEPDNFFFFDKKIFDSPPKYFPVNQKVKNVLSIMKLFDSYSEMMLMSYLLSSGALLDVLDLDKSDIFYTPLTGRNTYTFEYVINEKYGSVIHENGQVEIDAVFTGFKNGLPVIVVAEAKVDNGKYNTLAKHKLFYAYKSIQSIIKDDFEIIPIYVKLKVEGSLLTAKIAVCKDNENNLSQFESVSSHIIKIDL